jgi:hypothetical protein
VVVGCVCVMVGGDVGVFVAPGQLFLFVRLCFCLRVCVYVMVGGGGCGVLYI